jgi:hypothetical protein
MSRQGVPLAEGTPGLRRVRVTGLPVCVRRELGEGGADHTDMGGTGLAVRARFALQPLRVGVVVVAVVGGRLRPAGADGGEVLTDPAQHDPVERLPVLGHVHRRPL